MADKPSRALVIYGDGFASLLSPSHSHLHSFASRASCGFLSIRASPPSETENGRILRELAQVLDAYDLCEALDDKIDDVYLKGSSIPTISERFMGLKAALFSNCPNVEPFARKNGFDVFQFHELLEPADSSESLQAVPDEFAVTSKLLQLLGISGGDVLEKSEFDLVLLHIRASEKDKSINTDVGWLNKLVGGIMQTAQPGSSIASRLHSSIILSYGTVSESEEHCSLVTNSSTENNSDLYMLRPRQSYTMKGGNLLTDIRHHHPLLVAQWQEGVTRKDRASAFSFDEFKEHGANLALLADRFLHEVAFKLWKAPKYGA